MHRQDTKRMSHPTYTDADQDIYEQTEHLDNDPNEQFDFTPLAGIWAGIVIVFAASSLWLINAAEQYGASL
ncbi:hypothetical protein [Rhodococcus sp. RS1C4]|nr:hypothetical protein [Rhodococcus sp. RS1C4]